MSKSRSSEEKPSKVRVKVITRAKAEYLLSHGADPAQFVKHANYHVRRRCWFLMGRPLPDNTDDQNKFLATLQGMPVPKDAAALPGYYALLRQRILKEVPQTEEAPNDQENL